MAERFVIEVDLDAGDVLRDGKRVSGEVRSIGSAATGSAAKVGLLTKGLNALKANAIVAGIAAIYGAFRLLGDSVRAAGIQDIANRKLEQALKNVGEGGGEAAARLRQVAAELQKTSNFGDEMVITAQAMLLSFKEVGGSAGAELLTSRLADTAAGIQKVSGETVDLNTVAAAYGRALTQGAGALTEYNVSLSETEKEAFNAAEGLDRVRLLTEILDSNFGGLAAATVDPVKQLKNAISDLQEGLGGDLKIAIDDIAASITQIAQSQDAGRVVRFLGHALADVFRGIALAIDVPRKVARFFQTDLREAAAAVQEFVSTATRKLATFYAGVGASFANLPGIGQAIGASYINAAGTLNRFADAAGAVAEKNRALAAGVRANVASEEAADAARLAGADAARSLAGAIEGETDATTVATKAAEAYVGVVERMTAALIKLRTEKDDLLESDFFELVSLNRQAAALQRQIELRRNLVQAVAGFEGLGNFRGPAAIGTQAGGDPAAGLTADSLDLSGVNVEVTETQAAIEGLISTVEGLGDAFAGAGALASATLGRDAAAFKAVAVAQATISAYLAASKALATAPYPLNLGAYLKLLGIGLGLAGSIASVAIPGGSGGSSSSPRGRSPLTAGIGAGGGAGQAATPVNVSTSFSVEPTGRVVDGIALGAIIRQADSTQRRALGR